MGHLERVSFTYSGYKKRGEGFRTFRIASSVSSAKCMLTINVYDQFSRGHKHILLRCPFPGVGHCNISESYFFILLRTIGDNLVFKSRNELCVVGVAHSDV